MKMTHSEVTDYFEKLEVQKKKLKETKKDVQKWSDNTSRMQTQRHSSVLELGELNAQAEIING